MDIQADILKKLRQVERTEGVRVLYACESGSRAWGFASSDSDYDVRFIYIRRPTWYLSILLERRADVIEYPMEGLLDLNGGDLRKALQLMKKSNPPLFEWLGSPIVYREDPRLVGRLRELARPYYSPLSCAHHYLSMARGNYREYLRGKTVLLKKYLYVLRPLLAIRWIEAGRGVVPTEFRKLVEGTGLPPDVRQATAGLLQAKRVGKELDSGPAIPSISDFIEQEFARLESADIRWQKSAAPAEPLDDFFREALNQVWQTAER